MKYKLILLRINTSLAILIIQLNSQITTSILLDSILCICHKEIIKYFMIRYTIPMWIYIPPPPSLYSLTRPPPPHTHLTHTHTHTHARARTHTCPHTHIMFWFKLYLSKKVLLQIVSPCKQTCNVDMWGWCECVISVWVGGWDEWGVVSEWVSVSVKEGGPV